MVRFSTQNPQNNLSSYSDSSASGGHSQFSEGQLASEALLHGFASQATDAHNLAAMAVGSLAFSSIRALSSPLFSALFRSSAGINAASWATALTGEVAAFRATTQGLSAEANAESWHHLPGFAATAMDFAILKGFSHYLHGQSFAARHAVSAGAMVTGEYAREASGLSEASQRKFSERFAHAAVSSIALEAGGQVSSLATGGALHRVERHLQESRQSNGAGANARPNEASLLPAMGAQERETRPSRILFLEGNRIQLHLVGGEAPEEAHFSRIERALKELLWNGNRDALLGGIEGEIADDFGRIRNRIRTGEAHLWLDARGNLAALRISEGGRSDYELGERPEEALREREVSQDRPAMAALKAPSEGPAWTRLNWAEVPGFETTVRAAAALQKAGILGLGELLRSSEEALSKKGISRKAIADIQRGLNRLQLRLGMEEAEISAIETLETPRQVVTRVETGPREEASQAVAPDAPPVERPVAPRPETAASATPAPLSPETFENPLHQGYVYALNSLFARIIPAEAAWADVQAQVNRILQTSAERDPSELQDAKLVAVLNAMNSRERLEGPADLAEICRRLEACASPADVTRVQKYAGSRMGNVERRRAEGSAVPAPEGTPLLSKPADADATREGADAGESVGFDARRREAPGAEKSRREGERGGRGSERQGDQTGEDGKGEGQDQGAENEASSRPTAPLSARAEGLRAKIHARFEADKTGGSSEKAGPLKAARTRALNGILEAQGKLPTAQIEFLLDQFERCLEQGRPLEDLAQTRRRLGYREAVVSALLEMEREPEWQEALAKANELLQRIVVIEETREYTQAGGQLEEILKGRGKREPAELFAQLSDLEAKLFEDPFEPAIAQMRERGPAWQEAASQAESLARQLRIAPHAEGVECLGRILALKGTTLDPARVGRILQALSEALDAGASLTNVKKSIGAILGTEARFGAKAGTSAATEASPHPEAPEAPEEAEAEPPAAARRKFHSWIDDPFHPVPDPNLPAPRGSWKAEWEDLKARAHALIIGILTGPYRRTYVGGNEAAIRLFEGLAPQVLNPIEPHHVDPRDLSPILDLFERAARGEIGIAEAERAREALVAGYYERETGKAARPEAGAEAPKVYARSAEGLRQRIADLRQKEPYRSYTGSRLNAVNQTLGAIEGSVERGFHPSQGLAMLGLLESLLQTGGELNTLSDFRERISRHHLEAINAVHALEMDAEWREAAEKADALFNECMLREASLRNPPARAKLIVVEGLPALREKGVSAARAMELLQLAATDPLKALEEFRQLMGGGPPSPPSSTPSGGGGGPQAGPQASAPREPEPSDSRPTRAPLRAEAPVREAAPALPAVASLALRAALGALTEARAEFEAFFDRHPEAAYRRQAEDLIRLVSETRHAHEMLPPAQAAFLLDAIRARLAELDQSEGRTMQGRPFGAIAKTRDHLLSNRDLMLQLHRFTLAMEEKHPEATALANQIFNEAAAAKGEVEVVRPIYQLLFYILQAQGRGLDMEQIHPLLRDLSRAKVDASMTASITPRLALALRDAGLAGTRSARESAGMEAASSGTATPLIALASHLPVWTTRPAQEPVPVPVPSPRVATSVPPSRPEAPLFGAGTPEEAQHPSTPLPEAPPPAGAKASESFDAANAAPSPEEAIAAVGPATEGGGEQGSQEERREAAAPVKEAASADEPPASAAEREVAAPEAPLASSFDFEGRILRAIETARRSNDRAIESLHKLRGLPRKIANAAQSLQDALLGRGLPSARIALGMEELQACLAPCLAAAHYNEERVLEGISAISRRLEQSPESFDGFLDRKRPLADDLARRLAYDSKLLASKADREVAGSEARSAWEAVSARAQALQAFLVDGRGPDAPAEFASALHRILQLHLSKTASYGAAELSSLLGRLEALVRANDLAAMRALAAEVEELHQRPAAVTPADAPPVEAAPAIAGTIAETRLVGASTGPDAAPSPAAPDLDASNEIPEITLPLVEASAVSAPATDVPAAPAPDPVAYMDGHNLSQLKLSHAGEAAYASLSPSARRGVGFVLLRLSEAELPNLKALLENPAAQDLQREGLLTELFETCLALRDANMQDFPAAFRKNGIVERALEEETPRHPSRLLSIVAEYRTARALLGSPDIASMRFGKFADIRLDFDPSQLGYIRRVIAPRFSNGGKSAVQLDLVLDMRDGSRVGIEVKRIADDHSEPSHQALQRTLMQIFRCALWRKQHPQLRMTHVEFVIHAMEISQDFVGLFKEACEAAQLPFVLWHADSQGRYTALHHSAHLMPGAFAQAPRRIQETAAQPVLAADSRAADPAPAKAEAPPVRPLDAIEARIDSLAQNAPEDPAVSRPLGRALSALTYAYRRGQIRDTVSRALNLCDRFVRGEIDEASFRRLIYLRTNLDIAERQERPQPGLSREELTRRGIFTPEAPPAPLPPAEAPEASDAEPARAEASEPPEEPAPVAAAEAMDVPAEAVAPRDSTPPPSPATKPDAEARAAKPRILSEHARFLNPLLRSSEFELEPRHGYEANLKQAYRVLRSIPMQRIAENLRAYFLRPEFLALPQASQERMKFLAKRDIEAVVCRRSNDMPNRFFEALLEIADLALRGAESAEADRRQNEGPVGARDPFQLLASAPRAIIHALDRMRENLQVVADNASEFSLEEKRREFDGNSPELPFAREILGEASALTLVQIDSTLRTSPALRQRLGDDVVIAIEGFLDFYHTSRRMLVEGGEERREEAN